jgi:hypothetical protein
MEDGAVSVVTSKDLVFTANLEFFRSNKVISNFPPDANGVIGKALIITKFLVA